MCGIAVRSVIAFCSRASSRCVCVGCTHWERKARNVDRVVRAITCRAGGWFMPTAPKRRQEYEHQQRRCTPGELHGDTLLPRQQDVKVRAANGTTANRSSGPPSQASASGSRAADRASCSARPEATRRPDAARVPGRGLLGERADLTRRRAVRPDARLASPGRAQHRCRRCRSHAPCRVPGPGPSQFTMNSEKLKTSSPR